MFFVQLLYLSGSDRAILVYFIVNILRFAGQFKISQIGSHIQVIQVIEYLFAFIAVLYFFQLVLVHTFFRQCLQFLPYGCFGSFQRDAWGGFAGDMEQSLVNAARDIGVDAVEYLFLFAPDAAPGGRNVRCSASRSAYQKHNSRDGVVHRYGMP